MVCILVAELSRFARVAKCGNIFIYNLFGLGRLILSQGAKFQTFSSMKKSVFVALVAVLGLVALVALFTRLFGGYGFILSVCAFLGWLRPE